MQALWSSEQPDFALTFSLSLSGLYFCRFGQNMDMNRLAPIRSLGDILDHITSLQRELTELRLRKDEVKC